MGLSLGRALLRCNLGPQRLVAARFLLLLLEMVALVLVQVILLVLPSS